jgi:hypothetical protein
VVSELALLVGQQARLAGQLAHDADLRFREMIKDRFHAGLAFRTKGTERVAGT